MFLRIATHISVLFIVSIFVSLQASYEFLDKEGRTIIIRDIKKHDWPSIKDLLIKTFAAAYHLYTPEEIHDLIKRFDPILQEEMQCINDGVIIAKIAVHKEKIIAFLSAQTTNVACELYGRMLAIDPTFQKKGIAQALFKHYLTLYPDLKRVVCLTKKTNSEGQKFYEYLGGQKAENCSWKDYLYKAANQDDFIGYEFGEQALQKASTESKNYKMPN